LPDYPKRGRGRRYFDCKMYDACLALAAAESWEGFHCEGCPELQAHDEAQAKANDPFGGGRFLVGERKETAMQDKKEAVKLCETCGEKPTMHPDSVECVSCWAKRTHRAKRDAPKGKAPRGRPKKTPPKKSPRTGVEDYLERMEAGAEPVVTVHFDQHREILAEISRLAEEETRTVELEIIHLTKTALAVRD
jgi:hypothetical protein